VQPITPVGRTLRSVAPACSSSRGIAAAPRAGRRSALVGGTSNQARRTPMQHPDPTLWRLYALRAMYLLMAVGLGASFWPLVLNPPTPAADSASVVRALLAALGLMALLGLRYPVQLLPLLLFELLWKIVWVLAFGLPAWRHGRLDDYAAETLFACLMGVVLVPLVIPWRHAWRRFVAAPGDRWRR
jgi:hypothetical protein